MALEPLHADGSSVGSTGSTLLLALSRDPMTSVSPSSSTDISASSSCLLDLVEVISVGSSDEEDGSMVVPLQLVHVKRESGSSRGAGGGFIKYELCAMESKKNDVVDLCSDGDEGDDHTIGGDQVRIACGYVYERVRHRVGGIGKQLNIANGNSTTIRFKRRKTLHEAVNDRSAPDSRDTPASWSLSESGSEFAFSDNGDDDSSTTDGDDEEKDDESEVGELLGTGGHRSGLQQRPLLRHPSSSSSSLCSLSREQVDAIILRDVQRLEEKKPWRFAYRCLEVPFRANRTVDAFDLLFERWDAFWSVYGRAVWERYFWAPLKPGTLEHYRRKHRQTRAMRTYRELARDLCKKLGSGFLRKLTRSAHNGWWYRSDPLVLRDLFYLDRRKYSMYMTLHRERFPRGSRFECSLDPAWCLGAELTGGGCGGIEAACLVWQDVMKSDDDDDDEDDDEYDSECG